MPSVMRLVGALGGLDDDQVRATFNGGIGMVVVLAPDAVATALTHLESVGVATYDIGEVVPRGELDGERYAEGSLR
jgi:phosphoribosylaminoimidazole (AIR) synthetase